jgi:hypothetical protein
MRCLAIRAVTLPSRMPVYQCRMTNSIRLLFTASLFSIPACASDESPTFDLEIASVGIRGDNQTIAVGETLSLQGHAMARDGVSIGNGFTMTWTIDDPNVATISSPRPAVGEVRALASGSTLVRAKIGELEGTARLNVSPTRLDIAWLAPLPDDLVIEIGTPTLLGAAAYASDGDLLGGRAFTWTAHHSSLVAIDRYGSLWAHHAGDATIEIASEGRSSVALVSSVAVLPAVASVSIEAPDRDLQAGDDVWLRAMAMTADNRAMPGRAIEWRASDARVATVNGAGHVVTHSAGEVTITATSGGRTSEVTLMVTRG